MALPRSMNPRVTGSNPVRTLHRQGEPAEERIRPVIVRNLSGRCLLLPRSALRENLIDNQKSCHYHALPGRDAHRSRAKKSPPEGWMRLLIAAFAAIVSVGC